MADAGEWWILLYSPSPFLRSPRLACVSHRVTIGPMRSRLWEIAKLFLKLGTIGFGGPATHLALMEDEAVQRRNWLTRQHFLDLIGATNLIPGPNSTEMAIHIGYVHGGWAGLLVTSLNLLPAGQLDGGHLVYSLFGNRLKWIRPLIVVVLFILGFLWSGWWLWAFMILLLGGRYAEPLDDITDLNPARKALARLGLIIFFLIFMPVPLVVINQATLFIR